MLSYEYGGKYAQRVVKKLGYSYSSLPIISHVHLAVVIVLITPMCKNLN